MQHSSAVTLSVQSLTLYRVEAPVLLRGELQRLQHRQQHWAWAQQSWEAVFPKMLTLSPPNTSWDWGCRRIRLSQAIWLTPEPLWRGEIRHLAGQLFPHRNHPDGASPLCSAWVFIRTQTSASKDEAVWDTYLYLHSLLPALCPQFARAAQHDWEERAHLDGGTDAEGVPNSYNSPQDTGGCCTQQAVWGFPSPQNTPWQLPKERFSSFCRTELTQEAGDWSVRSSHVGKGDRKKSIW